MKRLFYARIIIIAAACCPMTVYISGQSLKSFESWIESADISAVKKAPYKQAMGIGSTVHAVFISDINEYNTCQGGTVGNGRLEISVDWYNKEDETGQFLFGMATNPDALQQNKESFRDESGFAEINEATLTNIYGGTLWLYTSQKECINTISGSTGVTEYYTQLRYFLFYDDRIIKIEAQGHSKAEVMKQMLGGILDKVKRFDFTPYKNTVATE